MLNNNGNNTGTIEPEEMFNNEFPYEHFRNYKTFISHWC